MDGGAPKLQSRPVHQWISRAPAQVTGTFWAGAVVGTRHAATATASARREKQTGSGPGRGPRRGPRGDLTLPGGERRISTGGSPRCRSLGYRLDCGANVTSAVLRATAIRTATLLNDLSDLERDLAVEGDPQFLGGLQFQYDLEGHWIRDRIARMHCEDWYRRRGDQSIRRPRRAAGA